jgi:FMN phosphatase YigB (HAD superfamily)
MRLKMTIKNITIFDLDGTVIDSSHRQATLPDGTLNLKHWFENATPEKIFKDKILPLAQQIRRRSKAGDYTMICTARTLSDADLEFFHQEGLLVDKIISRKQGDNTPDGELKAKQLRSFFSLKQFKDLNKVMFDDAPSVRKSLRRLGISVIDPSKIQDRVA